MFRAAQSQLVALRHLCGMAKGTANLNTDWDREVCKAAAQGDSAAFDRALSKWADGLLFSGFLDPDASGLSEPFVSLLKARKKRLVHRGLWADRANCPPPPELDQIRRFKLEDYLVENWICFDGCEVPGLMFWNNSSISKWVGVWCHLRHENRANLGRDYVQKIRQRLGLRPVNEKSPLVREVEVNSAADGGFKITLWGRDRRKLFQGQMRHPA